jgi:hypothetical protein
MKEAAMQSVLAFESPEMGFSPKQLESDLIPTASVLHSKNLSITPRPDLFKDLKALKDDVPFAQGRTQIIVRIPMPQLGNGRLNLFRGGKVAHG